MKSKLQKWWAKVVEEEVKVVFIRKPNTFQGAQLSCFSLSNHVMSSLGLKTILVSSQGCSQKYGYLSTGERREKGTCDYSTSYNSRTLENSKIRETATTKTKIPKYDKGNRIIIKQNTMKELILKHGTKP